MPQLREKPRQGFETWKTTRKPGSNSCNFTVALGLRATVVENGVRETYRARYYNPATGRFLSEDPIGFAGSGPNLYAYANENPLRFTDPSGMCNAAIQAHPCLKAAIEHALEAFLIALMVAVVIGFLVGLFAGLTGIFLLAAAEIEGFANGFMAILIASTLVTPIVESPYIYGAGVGGGIYGSLVCH